MSEGEDGMSLVPPVALSNILPPEKMGIRRRSYSPMSESSGSDMSELNGLRELSDDECDQVDSPSFARLSRKDGASEKLPDLAISQRPSTTSKWISLDLELSDSDVSSDSDDEVLEIPFRKSESQTTSNFPPPLHQAEKCKRTDERIAHPASLSEELDVSSSESRATTPGSMMQELLSPGGNPVSDLNNQQTNKSSVGTCGVDMTYSSNENELIDDWMKCDSFGTPTYNESFIAPTPLVISTFNEDSSDCDSDALPSPPIRQTSLSLSPLPFKVADLDQNRGDDVHAVTPVERDLCISDSESDSDLEERLLRSDNEGEDEVGGLHSDLDHALIDDESTQAKSSQELSDISILYATPDTEKPCLSQPSCDPDTSSQDGHMSGSLLDQGNDTNCDMDDNHTSVVACDSTVNSNSTHPCTSDTSNDNAPADERAFTSGDLFGDASSIDSESDGDGNDDDNDAICDATICDQTVVSSIQVRSPLSRVGNDVMNSGADDEDDKLSSLPALDDVPFVEKEQSSATSQSVTADTCALNASDDGTQGSEAASTAAVRSDVGRDMPIISTETLASPPTTNQSRTADIVISDEDDDDVIIVSSEQDNKNTEDDDGDDDDLMIIFQRNGRSSEIKPRYTPSKKLIGKNADVDCIRVIDCDPVVDMLDDESDDHASLPSLCASPTPPQASLHDADHTQTSGNDVSSTSGAQVTSSMPDASSLTQVYEPFSAVTSGKNDGLHADTCQTTDEVLKAVSSILHTDTDPVTSRVIDDLCGHLAYGVTPPSPNMSGNTGDITLASCNSSPDHSYTLPSKHLSFPNLRESTGQSVSGSDSLTTPPVAPVSPLNSSTSIHTYLPGSKHKIPPDDKTCIPLKKRCHVSKPKVSVTFSANSAARDINVSSQRTFDPTSHTSSMAKYKTYKRLLANPTKNPTVLYEMHRYLKPSSDTKRDGTTSAVSDSPKTALPQYYTGKSSDVTSAVSNAVSDSPKTAVPQYYPTKITKAPTIVTCKPIPMTRPSCSSRPTTSKSTSHSSKKDSTHSYLAEMTSTLRHTKKMLEKYTSRYFRDNLAPSSHWRSWSDRSVLRTKNSSPVVDWSSNRDVSGQAPWRCQLSTRRGAVVKPIVIKPLPTVSDTQASTATSTPSQLHTPNAKVWNWLSSNSNAATANMPVTSSASQRPDDLTCTSNMLDIPPPPHSPTTIKDSPVSTKSEKEVCGDCKKEVTSVQLSQCNMGHHCCSPCLQLRVKQVLAKSSTEMLLCPTPNCASSFSTSELRRLFPPMIVEILEEKMDQVVLNMIEKENKNKSRIVNPLLSSLPPEWTPMSESTGYRLVELSEKVVEYLRLALNFHSTMLYPRAVIKAIYRIQNPVLWQFYSVKKMQMQQDNDGEPVNEMQLYHGTRMWTLDPICKNNFDWRLSGLHGTFYGQGAYFARDAKYSHMYTDRGGQYVPSIVKYAMRSVFLPKQPDNPPSTKSDAYKARVAQLSATYHNLLNIQSCNGISQPSTKQQPMHALIIARVLVGKYTRGNASLRKPPPFSQMNPHGRCYDSCVDNEINPNIYCIFDTAQTYPEYIIEYSNAPPNAPT